MLWIYIIYIYLFLLKFSLNIFTFYSISSNIIFLLKKSKKNQRSRKIVPPAYLCYKKLTILYIFGVFKYFTAGNFFFFDFLSLLTLNKHKRVLFLLSMQIGTIGNMYVWYFLWVSLGRSIILEWDFFFFLIFSLYTLLDLYRWLYLHVYSHV